MYKYFNAEPDDQHLSDCVIRAMSLALAVPYYEIVRILFNNGIINECEEVCLDCYSNILEKLGFVKNKVDNRTIGEIATENADKILLIRMNGHLTCSIDGCIYDIWDCSNEIADRYWIIDEV